MANQFARSLHQPEPRVHVSNAGTSVLFDLLAVAACASAGSDWEKSFALFCCDSTRVGMGMDGFDLDELPFSPESWPEQRAFVLRALAEAATQFRGDELDVAPTPMDRSLAELTALVASYEPSFPPRPPVWRWPEVLKSEELRQCAEHHVFVGRFGECRFCRPDMDPQ